MEKKYAIVKRVHAENNQELLNASVSNSFDEVLKSDDGEYYSFSFVLIGGIVPKEFIPFPIVDEKTIIEVKQNESFSDYDGYKYTPKDSESAPITRIKAARKGWTYGAIPIEFETSQLDSLYSKEVDGTDRSGITLKFYDGNDDEITEEGLLEVNETNIVKTVIDFEPPYDYEIIGGALRLESDITTSDCRLWIIAVPDIPAPTGSKEMAGGINLKFLAPENSFAVDGRVSKYMTYDATYHTNKLKFIFIHDAGMKKKIHITIELYKA